MFFNVNEVSVYRALLAFIFSEKIFEGGMTRRDSRHCPQFLDSGNSSEFSISGGPVCSKARDSVLYEQSFLAGFPLFKQRGINYPPTSRKDRAVNIIEIKDFIILWTYSQ